MKTSQPIIPVADDTRLSRDQAAEFLGVSSAFLAADVVKHTHKIPHFKIGRRCVYSRAQLDSWMRARMVNAPA